jgi:hypothetical protein
MTKREEQMNRGRKAALLTPNPLTQMKTAFEQDTGQEAGSADWMDWTLGYCREVCGVASNR